MKRLADNLFDFGAEETTGERIVFRVLELFLVTFTVKYCWEWALVIGDLSNVMLPLGLANYVDVSFMFADGVALANAILVTVLCILGVVRKGERLAYAGALLLFHLQYVSRYSQGEISHGSNLLGMGMLGLAAAMLVFDEERLRRRFTMGFIYFFAGLGYTSAAICKLVGTGLHWWDGHHLILWMYERSIDVLSMYGAFAWNPIQELVVENATMGGAMLAFGLLAEFCGFLFWFRKTRYFAIPAVICMHIGVTLTMNIVFAEFTYQLLIIGLPWAALIDKLHDRRSYALARA